MRPPETLLLVGLALGVSSPAHALKLDLDCSRLAEDDEAELDARARLTIAALEHDAPAEVSLSCDAQRAWIVWGGGGTTEVKVGSDFWLVEAFLDALEQRVRHAKVEAQQRRELPPEPAAPPRLGAPKAADLQGPGGAGVRILVEPAKAGAAALVGPRLDIGVGLGRRLTLTVAESIRVGSSTTEPGTVRLIDVRLGLAYGAPFDGSWFGAQVSAGNDWFYSGSTLVASPSFDLGVRAALNIKKVALWLGVDAVLRARELVVADPAVSLGSRAVVFSVGGFLRAVEPLREPP